jgi:hypothetical protein
MARERRILAQEERLAKRDQIAASDTGRRRYGVVIVSFAVLALAYQLNLPWWHTAMITAAAYVGMTMAGARN